MPEGIQMTPMTRLAGVGLLALFASTPNFADSLASSASSAGSASVGSLSTSLNSSGASSPTTAAIEGDYRVAGIAAAVDRPGMLQLQLHAAMPRGADDVLWLTLPQQALAQHPLSAGDTVHARRRPYGIEFAHRAPGQGAAQAFFLVLSDDWIDELAPRAVTL